MQEASWDDWIWWPQSASWKKYNKLVKQVRFYRRTTYLLMLALIIQYGVMVTI